MRCIRAWVENQVSQKDPIWRRKRLIGWAYLPGGWVKVNTYEIAKGNPGFAGGGRVIRDSTGCCFVGFAINLSFYPSIWAEV